MNKRDLSCQDGLRVRIRFNEFVKLILGVSHFFNGFHRLGSFSSRVNEDDDLIFASTFDDFFIKNFIH